MRLVLGTALLAVIGCNSSTVRIPDGLPPTYVRSAVKTALRAHAGNVYWETLPGDPEADPSPYWRVQTAPHYCTLCGAGNGAWGFPLYWYHHTIEVYLDRVEITNHGYGSNLWLGVLSMLFPVYDSGGLYDRIHSELGVAERLRRTAADLEPLAAR